MIEPGADHQRPVRVAMEVIPATPGIGRLISFDPMILQEKTKRFFPPHFVLFAAFVVK